MSMYFRRSPRRAEEIGKLVAGSKADEVVPEMSRRCRLAPSSISLYTETLPFPEL